MEENYDEENYFLVGVKYVCPICGATTIIDIEDDLDGCTPNCKKCHVEMQEIIK